MTDTPAAATPRTDAEMAEYVRHHQCWQADRNVTIADWDRGVRAIEAEASRPPASRDALDVLAEVLDAVDALPAEHEAWGFRDEANRMLVALRERGWTLVASPPERSELDVERLARVLTEHFGPSYFPGMTDVTIHGKTPEAIAEQIAAEYAHLSRNEEPDNA